MGAGAQGASSRTMPRASIPALEEGDVGIFDYASRDIEGIGGRLKSTPADFRVNELRADGSEVVFDEAVEGASTSRVAPGVATGVAPGVRTTHRCRQCLAASRHYLGTKATCTHILRASAHSLTRHELKRRLRRRLALDSGPALPHSARLLRHSPLAGSVRRARPPGRGSVGLAPTTGGGDDTLVESSFNIHWQLVRHPRALLQAHIRTAPP